MDSDVLKTLMAFTLGSMQLVQHAPHQLLNLQSYVFRG